MEAGRSAIKSPPEFIVPEAEIPPGPVLGRVDQAALMTEPLRDLDLLAGPVELDVFELEPGEMLPFADPDSEPYRIVRLPEDLFIAEAI